MIGIAISQATPTTVIAEMVDSLHRNGLTRIIVINGHGGNVGPISERSPANSISVSRSKPEPLSLGIGYDCCPACSAVPTRLRPSRTRFDPLTSIGLHLFPELIRQGPDPRRQAAEAGPCARPAVHGTRPRQLRGTRGRDAQRIRRRPITRRRQGRSAPVFGRDGRRADREADRHLRPLHHAFRALF